MSNINQRIGGASWYCGRQVALEIMKSGREVQRLVLAASLNDPQMAEIVSWAQKNKIAIEQTSRKIMDAAFQGTHQGVALQVAEMRPLEFKSFLNSFKAGAKTFVVLLDEIQDPHNLGAILRSALCFNCAGVIVPKWRAAELTETVMKASSGAAAHIPVIEISNLSVAIERLKEHGFFIYGADVRGESVHQAEINFPVALVVGNEHRGVKPILKNACDKILSIPQTKTVASLNVSNAAAIFFYEIARRIAS